MLPTRRPLASPSGTLRKRSIALDGAQSNALSLLPASATVSRTDSPASQNQIPPSRLPTPVFPDPEQRASSRMSFFEFGSLRLPSFSLSLSLSRSGSGSSTSSTQSERTLYDSRTSLLNKTTNPSKLTQKWVTPQSLKALHSSSFRGKNLPSITLRKTILLALEDGGGGLGMEGVQSWTSFKWVLVCSIFTVFCTGVFVCGWGVCGVLGAYPGADILSTTSPDILILSLLCGSLLLLSSLIGSTGSLLNSRPILALYTLLLWPTLLTIISIGYIAYKRTTFSLDRKLDFYWSGYYTPLGRLVIQDALGCCGYYSPLHSSTLSNRCYPRTSLGGCKAPLLEFERNALGGIWKIALVGVVPLHLGNIVVSLLCVNHVTRVFGKGVMPRRYWLTMEDLRRERERVGAAIVQY